MIAGVVATLHLDAIVSTAALIAGRRDMEVGECGVAGRLPVTIESDNRRLMENATNWLRTCPGVLNVDVVYVHFEDSEVTASG